MSCYGSRATRCRVLAEPGRRGMRRPVSSREELAVLLPVLVRVFRIRKMVMFLG